MKDTDTHGHTHTDTHMDTHTERHTHRETHTQRDTHRERHTQRETHTQRDTYTETQRETHTHTGRRCGAALKLTSRDGARCTPHHEGVHLVGRQRKPHAVLSHRRFHAPPRRARPNTPNTLPNMQGRSLQLKSGFASGLSHFSFKR